MSSLSDRFVVLLHRWAGQWFPESRHGELERALQRSVARYGFSQCPESFIDMLEQSPSEELKDSVIQEVLVGETYFFRDANLWTSLRQTIIPELVSQHQGDRKLRLWSAGCSTGEEAYSAAMLLHSVIPNIDSWQIDILATDISEPSLHKARVGIYGKRATREAFKGDWGKHFDSYENSVQVKPYLRQMVNFRAQNLAKIDFPDLQTRNSDVIFCRNVLIYLDRELVAKIISAFGRCLSSQGWLILAPTEVPIDPPEDLILQQLPAGLLAMRPESANLGAGESERFLLRSEPTKTRQVTVINSPATSVFGQVLETGLNYAGLTLAAAAPAKQSLKSLPLASLQPNNSGLTEATLAPRPIVTDRGAKQLDPDLTASLTATTVTTLAAAAPPEAATDPSNECQRLAHEAQEKADHGDLVKALLSAAVCVDRFPTCVEGWLVLALIREEMDLVDDAIECLNRALYLEPSLAIVYLQMARLYSRKGHLDNLNLAINNFRKLVSNYSPDSVLPNSSGLLVRDAVLLVDQLDQNHGRQMRAPSL